MKALLPVLVLLLLAPCRVLAQPSPALTPAQARAALEVLNDPKKRAEVTATLEAIARAQPAPATSVATPADRASTAAAATRPGSAAPAPGAKPPPAAPEQKTLALAPDSLGAQLLLRGETIVSRLSTETSDALHAMRSLPLLWAWLVVMATNPFARGILIDVTWRLAVALACALAAEYLLRRLVQRPIRVLEAPTLRPATAARTDAHTDAQETPAAPADSAGDTLADPLANPIANPLANPLRETAEEAAKETDEEAASEADEEAAGATRDEPAPVASPVERAEAGDIEPPPRRPRHRIPAWTMLRRLPLALARLFLDLVPVLGFVLVGHLVTGSAVGYQASTRVVLLAVIDSYAICAMVLCVVRMLLSPHAPRLRLLQLPDKEAAYLLRWIRRLVVIAVGGYAIAEVGLLLGLSDVARLALLKADGFLLRLCLAVMVLQKRRAVRRWLRAPPDATDVIARVRNALASVWHWIALFFLAASWLLWVVDIPNGFTRALHFSLIAGLLLVGARLLLIVLDGGLDRALNVPPETAARYPGLEERLRLYHPGLSVLLRGIVSVLFLLALLQLNGVGGFTWFVETELGTRIVSACGTTVVTLLLALAAWEGANAGFQRQLAKLTKDQQVTRAARLRTLLPLLRSALLITVVVFAGLTVLSEIGIDIAPLLAGAGIIGVAIGFGSQKLVQDFITGIFLLLENAMQVGEFVTVSGLSGTVEALSVRTMRLRAGDGSVHIIPFSSVTTVTNVNRGMGNASVSVVVDYDEDTDRVGGILKEIVAGMRAEPDFAGKMLTDLQLWGVDKVDGAEATIVGQVVCTDSGRWSVQREFNRRMKLRFQELGIRLYNPMRSIAVTLPPAGMSPETAAPTTAGPDAGGANEVGPDTSGPKTAGAKTVGSDTVGPQYRRPRYRRPRYRRPRYRRPRYRRRGQGA